MAQSKSERIKRLEREHEADLDRRTREIIKRHPAPCNCGGPASGTGHSPDCEYVLNADGAREIAIDEQWDEIAEAREYPIVEDFEELVRLAGSADRRFVRELAQREAPNLYEVMNERARRAADAVVLEVAREIGFDPLAPASDDDAHPDVTCPGCKTNTLVSMGKTLGESGGEVHRCSRCGRIRIVGI